jgi:hypothetical protein
MPGSARPERGWHNPLDLKGATLSFRVPRAGGE